MILTVIGGGSSQWMKSLMRDVYLLDCIDDGEIRLVDLKRGAVDAVARMLESFNRVRGKTYKISVFTDRREALRGTDFVMTTFSPGSMDAFHNDLEIPVKYGIRIPVSMTVGPSGVSAALRTAPVAYEIVEDMEELCPGAWLLNVTNPMSVVTRAMNKAAKTVRVIGLCHEFHAFPRFMDAIFGLGRPDDVDLLTYLYRWLGEKGFDYTIAGVNHCIWITRATLHGEDMIPRIRQYTIDHRDMKPNGAEYSATANYNAAKFALCRTFGYLPIVGDRHLVEFWPSLCNQRNGFAMEYDVIKTTVDSRRHRADKSREEIERIARGDQEIDWSPSGEEMTSIMKAILTGTSVRCILNLPNRGQIINLPEDRVVETLGNVSADGAEAEAAGDLPGAIGSLCRLHTDVHEMTLNAALTGDRDLAVQAMSLDPLSAAADFSEIAAMTDELLLANREWMPRFA